MMKLLSVLLVTLVAIEHIYIMVLEMFLWTKPRTLKVFGMTKEEAETSKPLAANQGLYNGFLSAGLFWGLSHPVAILGEQIQLFFLCCILVAAMYAGKTVKKSILIVQGIPACLAILGVLLL